MTMFNLSVSQITNNVSFDALVFLHNVQVPAVLARGVSFGYGVSVAKACVKTVQCRAHTSAG